MAIKIIVSGLLIFMVYNLFRAMMVMLKGETTEPMSKYIGRRVLTSVIIVGLLLLALATGLITPNPRPY
jgi:tetrahydromethanopterin S-methyltransferase subunit G